MIKFFYTFLILLITNTAFGALIENHLECEPFNLKIDSLNVTSAPYYRYQVWPSYRYDETTDTEIPTCYFRKITSGGVQLEIEITAKDTFVDVENKLKSVEDKIYSLSDEIDSENEKYCAFSRTSYSMNKLANNNYKVVFYGDVSCYIVNDLDKLEKINIESLLKNATLGSDFKFEISAEPSPLISGTTIHN